MQKQFRKQSDISYSGKACVMTRERSGRSKTKRRDAPEAEMIRGRKMR